METDDIWSGENNFCERWYCLLAAAEEVSWIIEVFENVHLNSVWFFAKASGTFKVGFHREWYWMMVFFVGLPFWWLPFWDSFCTVLLFSRNTLFSWITTCEILPFDSYSSSDTSLMRLYWSVCYTCKMFSFCNFFFFFQKWLHSLSRLKLRPITDITFPFMVWIVLFFPVSAKDRVLWCLKVCIVYCGMAGRLAFRCLR